MASVNTDLITCASCQNGKAAIEFNENKRDGGLYINCRDCFRKDSAAFWASKNFKYCNGCSVVKPLSKYTLYEGVPYQQCSKCYAATLTMQRLADNGFERVDTVVQDARGGVRHAGQTRAKVSSIAPLTKSTIGKMPLKPYDKTKNGK